MERAGAGRGKQLSLHCNGGSKVSAFDRGDISE